MKEMNATHCYDEAVWQAYADGELAPEEINAAAQHLFACEACAARLAEIERAANLFADAFNDDADIVVPTERLRTAINSRIAELNAHEATPVAAFSNDGISDGRSGLKSWISSLAQMLGGGLAPQLAAACVLVVVGAVALAAFLATREGSSNNVAVAPQNGSVRPIVERTATPIVSATPGVGIPAENHSTLTAANKGLGEVQRPLKVTNTSYPRPERDPKGFVGKGANDVAPSAAIPGEKKYLEAIASLSAAIKAGGENSLSPALRVEYEKNLAVVDRAILETRIAARRAPQSAEARDYLLSAYQSKVELLSSIADQTQIASAR